MHGRKTDSVHSLALLSPSFMRDAESPLRFEESALLSGSLLLSESIIEKKMCRLDSRKKTWNEQLPSPVQNKGDVKWKQNNWRYNRPPEQSFRTQAIIDKRGEYVASGPKTEESNYSMVAGLEKNIQFLTKNNLDLYEQLQIAQREKTQAELKVSSLQQEVKSLKASLLAMTQACGEAQQQAQMERRRAKIQEDAFRKKTLAQIENYEVQIALLRKIQKSRQEAQLEEKIISKIEERLKERKDVADGSEREKGTDKCRCKTEHSETQTSEVPFGEKGKPLRENFTNLLDSAIQRIGSDSKARKSTSRSEFIMTESSESKQISRKPLRNPLQFLDIKIPHRVPPLQEVPKNSRQIQSKSRKRIRLL